MKNLTCPTCGAAKVRSYGKRYFLYPLGLVALLSLPLATLHQLSTPQEYRCDECGGSFVRRTKIAHIARIFLWLLVLGLALLVSLAFVAIIVSENL